MFRYKKIIILAITLVFLFTSLGVGVQNAQAASCTRYHTVKRGEWLAKIGRYYGVSWQYLAKINHLKHPSLIYAGQVLCVSTTSSAPPANKPPQTIPTFFITGVQRNKTVTIQTSNFPAHETYRVLMGPYGSQGINGIQVQKWNSGKGGTRAATFTIPTQLKGSYRIAIRLESISGSGTYAYNWFYNTTTGGGTGGAPPAPGYVGIPVFFISSVVRNKNVTITTHNFPAGLNFAVLMGPYGTQGINGIKVGTLKSGKGGTITATYPIPASLKGSYRIAIRAQNYYSGYYAYNWFYNYTTK